MREIDDATQFNHAYVFNEIGPHKRICLLLIYHISTELNMLVLDKAEWSMPIESSREQRRRVCKRDRERER